MNQLFITQVMSTTVEDAITDIYNTSTQDHNEKYHMVEILLTVCSDEDAQRCLSSSELWRIVVLPKLSLSLKHDNIAEMDSRELIEIYEAFRLRGHNQCQHPIDEQITDFLMSQQPSLVRKRVAMACEDMFLYDFFLHMKECSAAELLRVEMERRGIVIDSLDEEKLCAHFQSPIRSVVGKLYEVYEGVNKYTISHLFFIYQGLFKKEHTVEEVCSVYHSLRCSNYCRNAAKIKWANNLNFCSDECVDAYTSISNI